MVTEAQSIIMEFLGSNYLMGISQVMVKDKTGTLAAGLRGRLVPATAFVFNAASGSGITIGGQRNIAAPMLFKVGPLGASMFAGVQGLMPLLLGARPDPVAAPCLAVSVSCGCAGLGVWGDRA